MSVRFPHHGPGHHETGSHSGSAAARAVTEGSLPRDTPDDIPGAACCCPAKPQVKVLMPATASRPYPVDLWLCGHHWRASREALTRAGATVYDISSPESAADGKREGASVEA